MMEGRVWCETVMREHRCMNARCYLLSKERSAIQDRERNLSSYIAHCLCLLRLPTAGVDLFRSNRKRAA